MLPADEPPHASFGGQNATKRPRSARASSNHRSSRSWRAFDEAQSRPLVGVPNIVTMPVMMYSLVTGYSEPAAAVFSLLLAIPSLALLLVIRRHLLQGALASGFVGV